MTHPDRKAAKTLLANNFLAGAQASGVEPELAVETFIALTLQYEKDIISSFVTGMARGFLEMHDSSPIYTASEIHDHLLRVVQQVESDWRNT